METQRLVREILNDNSITPGSLVPLSGGQVNLAYNVDDRYVVRVGRDDTSRQRLTRETAIFNELEDRVPVPRILASGNIEDSTYQIQEYIAGTPLSRVWIDLGPSDKESIVSQLVHFLKEMHAITFRDLGRQFSDLKYNRWVDFWESEVLEIKTELSAIETRIPKELAELAFNFFEENKHLLSDGNAVFVHGDFWPGNILVEKRKVVGILDFEFATQAPVEFELLSLEHFCLYPNDYEASERYTSLDFHDHVTLMKRQYPEMFQVSNLRRRMDLYHVISTFRSHLGYLRRTHSTPKGLPVNPIAKITNFLYEEGARLF